MKKQEFLEELKGYLKVLQDEEQEDILDEYSQHIEMKKERGLSEEEAIRDFGPVQQLAGEILQAYHVKPEYEKDREKGKFLKMLHHPGRGRDEMEETGKAIPWREWKERGKTAIQRMGRKGGRLLCSLGRRILHCLRLPFLIVERAEKKREERRKVDPAQTEKTSDYAKCRERRMIFGIAGFLRCLLSGICWCCRLGWNFCVLIASVSFVCLGLFFLFLFGGLSVLWMRGYPLAGLVLGCLGAVLCFAALSILSGTFFWFCKREKKTRTMGQEVA